MKICCKCKEEKKLEEFGLRSGKKNILSECKKCVAIRSNAHYWKNREEQNEKRKIRYQNNKEKTLKKCKEYYEENREIIRKKVREKEKTTETRKKELDRAKNYYKKNSGKVCKKNYEWKKRHPDQNMASQYVRWGLKLNVIHKPGECIVCKSKSKLQAHHADYSKPLEVEWVCHICHMHKHGKLLNVDIGSDYGTTSRYNTSSNKTESQKADCLF